ncbi:hypothetical protein, partial [Synechococcus sp. OH2]|uniref:hypothetical protein n=1 Tax=Synechococcus sp. OH2 TaxID=136798 RepID=UPI0039C289CA
ARQPMQDVEIFPHRWDPPAVERISVGYSFSSSPTAVKGFLSTAQVAFWFSSSVPTTLEAASCPKTQECADLAFYLILAALIPISYL